MTFASPWLLLLAPLALVFLRRPAAIPVVTDVLAWAEHVSGTDEDFRPSPGRRVAAVMPRLLMALGVVTLLAAAAGPMRMIPAERPAAESVSVVLVLDVSGSMTEVVDGSSALDRTRTAVADFLSTSDGYRFGLVTFAGSAMTRLPPTSDVPLVLTTLQTAEVGLDPNGSAVGTALALAVERLRGVQAAGRAIILVSDGAHNAGPIDPETAADLAARENISLHAIVPFANGAGEGRLQALVRRAEGRVVVAGSGSDNLKAALASLVPALPSAGPPVPVPATAGFAFTALILLSLAGLLRSTRLGGIG